MVLAFILHHPSASLPQDCRDQNPKNNGSASATVILWVLTAIFIPILVFPTPKALEIPKSIF
jgi:hypothetical protein